MPHKTINSYPSLGKEINLPIFMRSVGCEEYQENIYWEEGYLYHQIYYLEEGKLQLIIEGKLLEITAGMGFFLRAHIPYQLVPLKQPCTTHYLSFGGDCTDSLFTQLSYGSYEIFPELDIKPLHMQLMKIYLLSTEDNFYSRCQNSALTYQYVMDVYTQNQKFLEHKEKEEENPTLLLAKRYIEQYYFTDLTLETLADFAHVSPQHLCRLFQKHMHMRPTHYINRTRIKVAKWRLHNTDMTIAEIAEEVGFHSPYYFSNTFKQYENISPSAYRKMVKGLT